MKKIISVLICFLFLLSFSVTASAEGLVTMTFVPSTETVHQNEQFSVLVEFNSTATKDVFGAQMRIVYDTTKLDFLSISPRRSYYVGGDFDCTQVSNFITVIYIDNSFKNPITKKEKAIFAINFKVKANATPGDISFSKLSAAEVVLVDFDGNEIPSDLISKTMKIVAGTAPATTTVSTAKTSAVETKPGETTAKTTEEITITTMAPDDTTNAQGNTNISSATDKSGNIITATTKPDDTTTQSTSNSALIIIIITAAVLLIGAGLIFFMIKKKNKNIE